MNLTIPLPLDYSKLHNFDLYQEPKVVHQADSEESGTFALRDNRRKFFAQNNQEIVKTDVNPVIRSGLRLMLNKDLMPVSDRANVEKTMERLYNTRTLTDCKTAKKYFEYALTNNKLTNNTERNQIGNALNLTLRIIRMLERKSTSFDRLKEQLIALKQTGLFFSPGIKS
jgi:hypothetical protein